MRLISSAWLFLWLAHFYSPFSVASETLGEIVSDQAGVANGSQVVSGNVIRTSVGSDMVLKLDSGTMAVKIKGGSEVRISKTESGGVSNWDIELNKGSVISSLDAKAKANRVFRVRSRGVVMGVRGTTFYVRTDAAKPLFVCTCEGEVTVAKSGTTPAKLLGAHHDVPKFVDPDSKVSDISQAMAPVDMTKTAAGHGDEDVAELKKIISITSSSGRERSSPQSTDLTHLNRHEFFFRYGAISDDGGLSAFPGTKFFALAKRDHHKWFTTQIELGAISDGRVGAKSSVLGTFSAGLETRVAPLFVYYLPGIALISGPDDYLSTFYQFSHDWGGGFRDSRGVSIHFSYRHFSNAGIHYPNAGRNFVVLTLGVPWDALFPNLNW